jgi:hypothetical protein
MFPDLARWQTTLPDRITIALLGTGKQEELRKLAEGYGLTNILVQDDKAQVFHAYNAAGTPSVVIVGPDGRIASPLRSTHVLIETMVRNTVRSDGAPTGRPSALPNEGGLKVVRRPGLTDTPTDSS